MGLVAFIADAIGASHDIISLMISVLLGYPLAVIYRHAFYSRAPVLQHLYFIACGLALSYFNYGVNVIHPVINIAVIYVMLWFCKGTTFSVVFSYIFNTLYVVVGCLISNPGKYGVDWTTSQCIICLKLTGVAFDLYDGQKHPEKLSKEQKETALHDLPTVVEFSGHVFFFGSLLVGPQFSMKRYQDLVRGAFSDRKTGGLPNSVVPAFKLFLGGCAYTAAFQTVNTFLPVSYLLTDSFRNSGFLTKLVTITVWGKFEMYKYLGVWQLSDGICTLTGLTYNGEDKEGGALWDGCPGTDIYKFETSGQCADLVQSFNISTNKWMAKYLFKRLRFLGNKFLSQALTLFYLAFWHGLYSGYYHNFFMEFAIVNAEKGVEAIYSKSSALKGVLGQPVVRLVFIAIRYLYLWFSLSYVLLSYTLFTYDKYLPVYMSVYFVGHVPFLLWPFISTFVSRVFVYKRGRKLSTIQEENTTHDLQTTQEEVKKEL